MLNQYVSIGGEGCDVRPKNPLVPLELVQGAVDPDLRARIEHVAVASGSPVPKIIPGAAATLLPLALPMASAKARCAAAGFAFEAHLASPLEAVVVSVGPQLSDGVWLCAATDATLAEGDVPILPDLCAVPRPESADAWALWWGRDLAFVRLADGGGLCVDKDAFYDLWRGFGQPRIMLYFGTPPSQIPTTAVPLPDLDPSILKLDLRAPARAMSSSLVRRLAFATVLGFATAFAHGVLILKDARVLDRVAVERIDTVTRLLQTRGISATLAEPLPILAARIERQAVQGQSVDPFLEVLSRLAAGLERQGIGVRTMRYTAEQGSLTLQAVARDLPTLQTVEDRLTQSGLSVQSGSAAQVASGAEVQLIVSSL